MNVVERMARRQTEDVIEIGNILEQFYSGEAGTIFRAIINGRIKAQFIQVEDTKTSADRRLGRAEGMQLVQDDIELAIQQKNELIAPIVEE